MTINVGIDPGHGGKDPGTSHGGLVEKDWVLEVGYLLLDMLSTNMHCSPTLLRVEDVDIGLREAADSAMDADCDLVLSLHVNANDNTLVRGLMTFHLPSDVEGAEMARGISDGAPEQLSRRNGVISATQEQWPRVCNVLEPYLANGIPACLIEFGFATNEYDRKYLLSQPGKYACALAAYHGVLAFWGTRL